MHHATNPYSILETIKWTPIALLLSLLMFSGCGGYSIRHRPFEYIESQFAWQTPSLRTGDKIKVYLKNADSISGKYKGWCHFDAALLAAQKELNDHDQNRQADLPSIGDTITLTLSTESLDNQSNKLHYLYAGLDKRHILVKSSHHTRATQIDYNSIDHFTDTKGHVYPKAAINKLISKADSLENSILIQRENSLTRIAVDDIDRVSFTKNSTRKLMTKLLIGLTIAASAFLIGLFFWALSKGGGI
jgi:hypothetical protein